MCLAAKGSKVVPGVLGPIARCTNDLALWMKTATCEEFYKGHNDPYVKLRPFDS